MKTQKNLGDRLTLKMSNPVEEVKAPSVATAFPMAMVLERVDDLESTVNNLAERLIPYLRADYPCEHPAEAGESDQPPMARTLMETADRIEYQINRLSNLINRL